MLLAVSVYLVTHARIRYVLGRTRGVQLVASLCLRVEGEKMLSQLVARICLVAPTTTAYSPSLAKHFLQLAAYA